MTTRGSCGVISQTKLAWYVRKILKVLGWKRVGISIVLVDDQEIRRLHRRYRGKDEPTDVLAFSQMEGRAFPKRKFPLLGDVVASIDTAKRRGPHFGNNWQVELLLYLCHGILHLMGWRDSTSRSRIRMERKQEAVLNRVIGTWRSKKPKRLF